MTYGLNDVCLTPARISRVEHRSQCNPFNCDNMLPLFTAPMNSVINETNYSVFLENKINTIIPRGVDYNKRWELSINTFVAVGLDEFKTFIKDYKSVFESTSNIRYVCVDIANGHMKKLLDICTEAKNLFRDRLILMAGNIANPDTYVDYAIAGIDFCRVSIGSGASCITSCQTAVHYGLASLIKDVADKKWEVEQCIEETRLINISSSSKFYIHKDRISHPYKSVPFIVADGGFDNYDKIIKALALGADFVMVGKLFAQCEEACQEPQQISCVSPDEYIKRYPNLPRNLKWIYDDENKVYTAKARSYYGMSTKRAQIETGNKTLKTSEGIERLVPVLYNLNGWCDNFISYLQSAMSYTDSFNLKEFKNSKYNIISYLEYLSFYK